MGGGRRQGALAAGILDDGDGQGRTLYGIRTGPQLVEQQQAVLVRLPEDLHGVGHMGGEGGQALLDALLVAHVSQDAAEHSQAAAAVGRDVQAALSHEAQQTDGLQGDSLAAGVGAGDDQGVKCVSQLYGDGHRLGLIQQGMPGPVQADTAPLPQLRAAGVQLIAQLSAGENHIKVH